MNVHPLSDHCRTDELFGSVKKLQIRLMFYHVVIDFRGLKTVRLCQFDFQALCIFRHRIKPCHKPQGFQRKIIRFEGFVCLFFYCFEIRKTKGCLRFKCLGFSEFCRSLSLSDGVFYV